MFLKKNSLNKGIEQIQTDLDELTKENIEKNKLWISENYHNLNSKTKNIADLYLKNIDIIEKYHHIKEEVAADHLKMGLMLVNEIINSLQQQSQAELLSMRKKIEELRSKITLKIKELQQSTIQIKNDASVLYSRQKLADAIKLINAHIETLQNSGIIEQIGELENLKKEIEAYMLTISNLATKFVEKQYTYIQTQIGTVPPDQINHTIREIFEGNVDNFQFLLKLEKIHVPPKEMLVDYCVKI